jgi:hypothetical protein
MASKPATDEEKQEICKVCAKDMANMSIDEALNDASTMKIDAPPALDAIKQASQNLKDLAKEIRDKGLELGAGDDEEEAEAPAAGGVMGSVMGMFSKAAEVAADVAGKAGEYSLRGVAKGIRKSAEGLDEVIKGVEEPMTRIGEDIARAKKDEIIGVIKEYIKGGQVPKAEELCMKGEPDAISKSLITAAAPDVATKLKVPVEAAMQESGTIKAWDACIDTYNAMCDQLAQMKDTLKEHLESEMLDSMVPGKIELDLNAYICEKVALEVGRLMGLVEARKRDAPQNLGSFPDIFLKVFRKDKVEGRDDLMDKDFKEVTKKK